MTTDTALLKRFVELYASGAQGCEMDFDSASAVAQAIDRLTAERDGLKALAEFVKNHWDNQDMNHADFRVHAYQMALAVSDADSK